MISVKHPFTYLREILDKREGELSIFGSWVTRGNAVGSMDECIDRAKAIVTVTEHSDGVEKMNDVDFSRYRD